MASKIIPGTLLSSLEWNSLLRSLSEILAGLLLLLLESLSTELLLLLLSSSSEDEDEDEAGSTMAQALALS